MPDFLVTDQALLTPARAMLADRAHLCWILGGSCTGKSTVARYIAGTTGIEMIDMDVYIFDRFMPAYDAKRHPASKAWFGADNPLAWALSLSWEEFDSLNRASNAEFLDLLAHELRTTGKDRAIIIDGGFTHPSVLTQVVSPSQIVCLQTTDKIRFETWETAEDRLSMKQSIRELPDGQAKWQKFLFFDKMIAETMVEESQVAGIPTIARSDETSVATLSQQVMEALGIADGEL